MAIPPLAPLSIGDPVTATVYNDIIQAINGVYTGWTTPSYSAGNFTGNASMTWTVQSGDIVTYAYHVVGKTMTVAFYLGSTSVGGTPSATLQVAIPGGFTAAAQTLASIIYNDNGAGNAIGFCQVMPAGTLIQIRKSDLSNWSASTNATGVQGQIAFEVQ